MIKTKDEEKNMEIKPFEKEDFSELFNFMKPLWEETYGSILPARQIEFLLDHYFSDEAVSGFIGKGYKYFTLKEENRLCGVTVICDGKDGSVYLDKLYINEDSRGKGYPGKVFGFLLGSGKDVTLNVNQKNARAIKCYKKNGFKVEEEQKIDLGDGMTNVDYFMRLTLSDFLKSKAKAD